MNAAAASRLLRRPHPGAVHAGNAGHRVRRLQGHRDARGGAAGRHREGRRPAGEDAHPAGGRGETEPQENGRPGHCLRRRARHVPPARRDRPARRPAGNRTPRPGPKARAKWLAGSVRKDPAEVIAAAFDEAEARDPQHLRTWVVFVDGAERQLALIRAEAARRGVTIHIVIDIIHVLEYIWGAAWSLHEAGDPAAEDWVAAKALAVLGGERAGRAGDHRRGRSRRTGRKPAHRDRRVRES